MEIAAYVFFVTLLASAAVIGAYLQKHESRK